MTSRWLLLGALAASGTWGALPVHAAGYGIYEQGAAVLGMAGAGTAGVSDPSALFFNPAVMTRLEGQQFAGGGTWLTTVNSFAGVAPEPGFGVTEEMEQGNFFLPTLHYTQRFNDRWAAGAGLYAPFGLGVAWANPDQFTGRHIVTEAHLATVNAGVNVAYAFSEQWSVALGGNAVFAKVKLENVLRRPIPGGGGGQFDAAHATLESDLGSGLGWNTGLSFAPNENWTFGATYRGKTIIKPEGDATFDQILTGNASFDAQVAAQLPPDQGVSTVVRLPAIWAAGVAYQQPGMWKIEADVVFTEWSLFSDLPIYFDQTPQNNTVIEEDYEDTWAFRVGGEIRRGPAAYRAGYYFEQEAAPDESMSPLLPDAPRHGFTAGFGWDFGSSRQWTLDVYNLALFPEDRGTNGVNRDNYNGDYKSYVNAFGASLTWRR